MPAKEVGYELTMKNGLPTIFGNLGSSELPFLGPISAAFRYISLQPGPRRYAVWS
ncbi:hypothetical protein [Arthrobacter mangrovi]|uniref:Uncharacterized protein n=1 Tax=Arthrobacter mangrovi TaxID=2966350 RepID=A0ABQ5MRF1_9MICC|nr:hypothetical protein [Arthrobacter mangrovi]GLB66573.1 hypothetical protein AHIS1636_10120 [Arthrobacter mangrovi]